jgi:predicted kinase
LSPYQPSGTTFYPITQNKPLPRLTKPDTARVALPDIKRLIPNYGENDHTLHVIREVMKAMVDKYLEHGVSVVLEQISKAEGVEILQEIATMYKAKFYPYRLTAPKDLRWERVQERTKGMVGVDVQLVEKIKTMKEYFEPNHQFYIDNPIERAEIIDTSDLTPDKVADYIINKLV